MRRRKFYTGLIAACLAVMISASALGDDLEIYLGSGSQAVTYNPNVLFIMDTSGSMSSKDGGTQSRMLRVQNALRQTLGAVTNVNAGLMRFSDYGGPVLFPVRAIDDPVSPELIVPVTAAADDAYEIGGMVTLGGNHVKLSQGSSRVYSGFRFQNLNIPRNAQITNAFVRFTSNQLNTSATELTIRAELTGDAVAFSNTNNNLSSRTATTNFVDWNLDNDWPLSGETTSSPDLTAVIQEVVDQSSWCGGNDLSILMEGISASSGSARQAISFEEGSGLSPQLVITYDDSTATGCVTGRRTFQVSSQRNNAEERHDGYQSTGSELTFNNNYNRFIGMRFNNIGLPQGAVISNAYLEFTAYQNRTGSGASFTIMAANEDDPSDFRRYPRYYMRDKPKTTAVTWSNIPAWYKDNTYRSPPLTAIVQQLVNRSGWRPSNEMMFIVSNITGNRGAYSYNGRPSGAARLVIEYQGNATPGTSATVRQHLISKVDELSASGYTPIVDTLYEAALYYGGRDVDYGLSRGNSAVSSTVRRNTRVSHRSSYIGADSVLPNGCSADNLSDYACIAEAIPNGASYISPVQDLQCQTNNHIVLLSDGIANNNHSTSKIKTLLGRSSCSGYGGETCGVDLVKNISESSESAIDARVITHTIGFAAGSTANDFLNQLALQSGGGFYTADNTADLVTAFQTILQTVKDVNATFVSPGVAVNQLNRLTHRDELYFALFKPAEGTIWPGNLKKYKIKGDRVLDKNNSDAVDSNTGFFKDSSHSYWSTLEDGNDVREGGAASLLDATRNAYVFDTAGTIINNNNRLHEGNTSITAAALGISGLPDETTLRNLIIKWARGVDVRDDDGDGSTSDSRKQMGDPIHSQPVIVNYSDNDSAIFVATNQGFLHSFDASNGEENFAIMPTELLSNIYRHYQDSSTYKHIYGLDGDMVVRNTDSAKYLYLGMRRGGHNYYVFDVSAKTSPRLVFKVVGGSAGFEKLGQTWSRPTLTKINIGGSVKNVMIVGGGYDEVQDSKAERSDDVIGNAVYIIDADSGKLLWSASNSAATMILDEMDYSIPARISVVDRENDGLADHMYVADTGGQLFRLDIHNGKSGSELVTGGLMASLGGDSAAQNRRFYYGPDVSEISLGDDHYYAVALGSGYRAHPLNTEIQDNFYMIKDYGVFTLDEEGNYTLPSQPFVESDLYDASAHLLTANNDAERELQTAAFARKDGWMIRLKTGGEKVLASPLILDYKLFFTTYLPASASDSLCAPPTGNSRAYLVELVNGNAVADMDKDKNREHKDRYAELTQTGIAPETKILIEDIVKPVVCLGTECASAVIEVDDKGNEKACKTGFECLTQHLYGRFERVQRSSWKTEVERP